MVGSRPAQEKLKTAITAATGYEPVAVSVSFDFADSKKTIETILEQDRYSCADFWFDNWIVCWLFLVACWKAVDTKHL